VLFNVIVMNVPPVAAFNAPAQANQGAAFTLALAGASDPSSADAAAGFSYAFDCGDGAGAFTPAPTATCVSSTSGAVTVRATLRDKDGGSTTYARQVTVRGITIEALIDQVLTLDLQRGAEQSLTVRLSAAGRLAARGQRVAAAALLRAFIVDVKILNRANRITDANAEALVTTAATLIVQL
jgi:hypothetical protein